MDSVAVSEAVDPGSTPGACTISRAEKPEGFPDRSQRSELAAAADTPGAKSGNAQRRTTRAQCAATPAVTVPATFPAMTLLLLDLSLCAGVAGAFLLLWHGWREQLRAAAQPVRVRSRDRDA